MVKILKIKGISNSSKKRIDVHGNIWVNEFENNGLEDVFKNSSKILLRSVKDEILFFFLRSEIEIVEEYNEWPHGENKVDATDLKSVGL